MAEKRLSADIINFSSAQSSVKKGETLIDTVNNILSMKVDIVVLRHPNAGASELLANNVNATIINAGDGANEHPTQALLDLYTIRKELAATGRDIDGLTIAMVGDLRHGRTVHSLCKLLCLYDNVKVVLVSPKELLLPAALIDAMRSSGVAVETSEDLAPSIADVDIVYSTRIQEERFGSKQEADLYRGRFRLNQAIYTEFCQPNTVIMHPLPRDSRADANELDNDLNNNPNLAIFRQTDNGVLVRMALFALVLDVVDTVDKYSHDIRWFNARA